MNEVDVSKWPVISDAELLEALSEAADEVGQFWDPRFSCEFTVSFFDRYCLSEDSAGSRGFQRGACCYAEKNAITRCIRKAAEKVGLPCRGKHGIKVEDCGADADGFRYIITWEFDALKEPIKKID